MTRVRMMLFFVIALMLVHSANVILRASGGSLRIRSADGRAKKESAQPKMRPYASGEGRSMSKREKVAMWLERVAAGAASVPPHLLEGEEPLGSGGQAGSTVLSGQSAGRVHQGGMRMRFGARAEGSRGVQSLQGKPDAGTVPISVRKLRAITARVDAEEAALSNSSVIWPRVFIIGAPKAASSTLSRLLSYHTQICKARTLLRGTVAKEVGILFAHRIKVSSSLPHPRPTSRFSFSVSPRYLCQSLLSVLSVKMCRPPLTRS